MSENIKSESLYNVDYILSQITKIQEQTEYLNKALEQLSQMSDGDSGSAGAPGNILGEAKARAIGDVVRCRETTNQQMLSLYEKMYNDLRPLDFKKFDVLERVSAFNVGLKGDKKIYFK